MLLFWRKRRGRKIARTKHVQEDGPDVIENNADKRKTLILLIVLHLYIVACALAFQKLEYVKAETQQPNLKQISVNISNTFNVSNADAMLLIRKIIAAEKVDRQVYMSSSWSQFTKAFWFVTILFTTVGTGHIVPITFYGRLFAVLTALFGIPLYALFLKHFGECILQVNRRIIRVCESSRPRYKRGSMKNTKMVLFAFLQMMFIIGMGALGAIPFHWTYFQGIYFCFISLSTVGFGDLIPDLSGDKAIYGIIYMFYNVIGLGFVSCFICSVVNAIDDFKGRDVYNSIRRKKSSKNRADRNKAFTITRDEEMERTQTVDISDVETDGFKIGVCKDGRNGLNGPGISINDDDDTHL